MSVHPKLALTESASAAASGAVLTRFLPLPVSRRDRVSRGGPLSRPQRLAKRILDIVVAAPLLVLMTPAMAAIAVAIRLDSPGPAFFHQQRLGLHGRPFAIVKFRTMTVAEDGAHVVQACKNDPRITRVGCFLRMWSLDELPQLYNVLKGEMSLVGPRPHACAHDEFYSALIGHYEQRQRVKPGITGWAQVNGHRGETPTIESMRARVDFDVWYARHAGIALDLEILFRTAFEVFRRRNAY